MSEALSTVVLANPRDRAAVAEAAVLGSVPEAAGTVLFRTSGSTGRPKWVALRPEAIEASAHAVNRHLDVVPDDVWLRVLPVFHVGGYTIPVRARLGGCQLVEDDEKWQPGRLVRLCEDHGVTLCSLVPAQVHDLVESAQRCPARLRAIVVGGGELRPAVWQQARALGWPVLTSYGLSEAASQVATLSRDALARPDGDPAWLTVLPHWRTRLGESGTLQLQGPALFSGYCSRDEDGGWRWEAAGEWFETQDRVEWRDGRLRFVGRRDAVVKILGELVDLASLDRRLADLTAGTPARGRVRLLAEPDERAGRRLVLEVAAALDAGSLIERFNALQPPFARIAGHRTVETLALSALGKVLAQPPPAPTGEAS